MWGADLLANLEEDENPYVLETSPLFPAPPPPKKPPSQSWDNQAHLKHIHGEGNKTTGLIVHFKLGFHNFSIGWE